MIRENGRRPDSNGREWGPSEIKAPEMYVLQRGCVFLKQKTARRTPQRCNSVMKTRNKQPARNTPHGRSNGDVPDNSQFILDRLSKELKLV